MAALLLLSGCGTSEQSQAPELLAPVAVGASTATVQRRDFYDAEDLAVSVVPQTAELHFTMEGVVDQILVNEGQTVTAGQTLAVIDQSMLMESIEETQQEMAYTETSYSYQLQEASYGIQIAQLQLSQLQADYEKQEQLKQEAETAARAAAENPLVSLGIEGAAGGESSSPAEESNLEQSSQESTTVEDSSSEVSQPDESTVEESSETSEPSAPVSQPEDPSSEPDSSQSAEGSSLAPSESTASSQVSDSADSSSIPQPPQQSQGITQYDLRSAQLAVEEAQMAYRQIQEEYNQQMAQQQAQLQSLQAKVGDDTVVAPTDGRIVKLSCNIGDTVREYQTIMTLADENTLMLTGQEYSNSALKGASRLAVIIEGQEYPVTYVPYDDEEYVRLKMEDQNTPTRFLFQGEAPVSFGQSGTVLVYRAYSEDTLVVPKACVQSDELGSFVNVIKEDGSREKTYVSVGIQTDAFIEITEGLEEGDVVYANE